MNSKQYYVYILANRDNAVLYTGFTGDLLQRVYAHKMRFVAGFTKRYNVDKLVYYEAGGDALATIAREKQIKGWTRVKKDALISAFNPDWHDLYKSLG
jgi:putative endonuclease